MAEHRGRLLALVLAVAAVPRLLQAGLRWDEVALAYAAYTEPAAAALADGAPTAALGAWVGLHPPLHALLMGALELVWPAPVLWLGLSVACSLGAVALVGWRAGPLAALLLASSPLQVAYAAELNNYPLAVLAVAALLAAGPGPWWALLAAVGLACQAHVLAAAAAGGAVLHRLRTVPADRGWVAAWAVVLAAPTVLGALRLAGGSGTFVQPPFALGPWVAQAAAGIGAGGLLLGAGALAGLRGPTLAVGLPLVGLMALSLLLGAAAPHQLPYLLLPAPVLAVALGTALAGRPRWLRGAVALVCLLRLGPVLGDQLARAQAIRADLARPRAVDRALAESAPGDVVWLVAPALQADDDKTDTSPVLWRLGLLDPMPMARDGGFDYLDWRFGQPRRWRGRVIHTSTELAEQPLDHVLRAAWAGGHTVFVVLYDHAPATDLAGRVERAVRPWSPQAVRLPRSAGLGDDWLYRLAPAAP